MQEGSRICNMCWNNSGCDPKLTPQLISRHGNMASININDARYSQSDCRHFTCTSGGLNAAEDAIFVGNYETIITPDGPKEAVTFESEDKRTKQKRWIDKDGVIYSCEANGGIYYKTGQRLDKESRFHY
jgi:hypothetical protein